MGSNLFMVVNALALSPLSRFAPRQMGFPKHSASPSKTALDLSRFKPSHPLPGPFRTCMDRFQHVTVSFSGHQNHMATPLEAPPKHPLRGSISRGRP